MGRAQAPTRHAAAAEAPLRPAGRGLHIAAAVGLLLLVALPWLTASAPYATVLAIDLLVGALFAASLHFIMARRGCIHSAMRPTSAWGPMAPRCWC